MKVRTKEQTIISGITRVTIQYKILFFWFSFGCYYKDAQGNHFFPWDFGEVRHVKYEAKN